MWGVKEGTAALERVDFSNTHGVFTIEPIVDEYVELLDTEHAYIYTCSWSRRHDEAAAAFRELLGLQVLPHNIGVLGHRLPSLTNVINPH